MRDEDQKNRNKWVKMRQKGKGDTDKFREFTQELIDLDRENTARLREIVQKYGWPTYEMVGEGPSNNAWLIVQHADRNPLFQAKCLPLLKEAVDKGQANPSNYAYLYDRVAVSKGEKQLYATQSSSNNGLVEGNFYPIEDEAKVQTRREEMNIDRNVEDYASSMGFEYKIPTESEAKVRAQKLAEEYEIHVLEAKKAMIAEDYQGAADEYLQVTTAYGHVTTEDFLMAAKSLSLAEHEKVSMASTFILRALSRGWDGFEELQSDTSFNFFKKEYPGSWEDLIKSHQEIPLDK